MTETTEKGEEKPSRVSRPGRLELRKTVETGQVRQRFPHGRSKAVTVEIKRKRTFAPGAGGDMAEVSAHPSRQLGDYAEAEGGAGAAGAAAGIQRTGVVKALTAEEKAARVRALRGAIEDDDEARQRFEAETARRLEEERQAAEEEVRRKAEEEARRRVEQEARRRADDETRRKAEEEPARRRTAEPEAAVTDQKASTKARAKPSEGEVSALRGRRSRAEVRRHAPPVRRVEARRQAGKLTIVQALSAEEDERIRSLASVRRARERERQRAKEAQQEMRKIVRDVIVPESITLQELANRMAERGADVVKVLMKMGVMATINEAIDGDTAELAVAEFGHNVKRVAESDVEIGLEGGPDAEASLEPRAPVVTVMGHVDHGKTSLLDALRETDVASREAGGITQHIGAYQVQLSSGRRLTFLDTPGHEAFTAMRARGAKVTDVVVLVVAADDGIQPQAVEAINHAKAAGVPIIVAINKIDRPEADPARIRKELLNHEVVVEEMGGDVLNVEVSATKRINLDKLEEAILLQAEILDLKANPQRPAQGVVIESRLERGRGPVATVLVQRGTLRVGDVLIAGSEWGRVRGLVDDRGNKVTTAGPGTPVEVFGLNGAPSAGDDSVVVDDEGRAREITDFRRRKLHGARVTAGARGTVEQMFSKIAAGEMKELPVVVKADVRGSAEAIVGAIMKLSTEEVSVRILHSGVGGINESDVALAKASEGLIIGFNVRANPQARVLAHRDNVDIRYYSVIYNVVDDVKVLLSGMLEPTVQEKFLGNAEVRQVFDVSKAGKIAGCKVTEGLVRRGAAIRLLRDNVVIYQGSLKSLKHHKDEVKEIKEGFECGMAFENYQDIQGGDIVECYEEEEVTRAL
ncbi:MAG: translation initiation factor IF-2 [Alphaproteobacteria bacterium]